MTEYRFWLYPIGIYILLALCFLADASWWITAIVALPAIFAFSGWGWALWLHRKKRTSPLQIVIDSCWISLLLVWIDISLIRELGFGQTENVHWIFTGMSFLWLLGGLLLSRKDQRLAPLPPRERQGIFAIFIALCFLIWWKQDTITRPLDGYWYLENADDPRHSYQPIRPANDWKSAAKIGWPEAGAYQLIPNSEHPTLIADHKTNGRIYLAVRGPIGSYIEAKGERNEVAQSMAENPEEGPVRRYLDRGVAAISIWAALQPGEQIELNVKGDEVYLLTSSDAVWALHAEGVLRYTFYYQLLNQVENQVWAEEVLENRRFTWNQPPGWSPILAASNIVIAPDLNGAACLFLYVLSLLGLSSLRLTSVIAPRANLLAWNIPALFLLIHALLLFEPASHNFPDSLYTVAILGMLTGLFQKEPSRFGLLGVATQALRWPGTVLSSIFALLFVWSEKIDVRPYLKYLWLGTTIGILITILAMFTGDAEDVLFILYFETFPEHWHDNYNLLDLIQRYPNFYGKWMLYSGGTFLLSLPFFFHSHNRSIRVLLGGALIYSLILGTIDHDPSHYFLPLIAVTGPAFVAASSCIPKPKEQYIFVGLGVFGIIVYLWLGIV